MRTILVLNHEHVLGAAILHLLQAEDGLAASGFSLSSTAELVEKLCSDLPHVVILDNSRQVTADVQQCLVEFCGASGLCVIVVDANDTHVSVNGLPDISINGLHELVDLVRTSP